MKAKRILLTLVVVLVATLTTTDSLADIINGIPLPNPPADANDLHIRFVRQFRPPTVQPLGAGKPDPNESNKYDWNFEPGQRDLKLLMERAPEGMRNNLAYGQWTKDEEDLGDEFDINFIGELYRDSGLITLTFFNLSPFSLNYENLFIALHS
jgi:hypothetical protein